MKTLKQVTEAADKLHPDALHVKSVKVDGKTKYQVHAVGHSLLIFLKQTIYRMEASPIPDRTLDYHLLI